MSKNVCGADRVIRIILGLVLIAWGLYAQNWWGAIGIVPLLTAILGWCPLYLPFGWKTCKPSS